MTKPRNCSLWKCDYRILTDVIKCHASNWIFTHNATVWSRQLQKHLLNNNNNFLFLCDNCITVAHPLSLLSFATEVTELETAVGNMASAMSAQTAQLPPSALSQNMLTSLGEINKSLISLNEDRGASSEQDAEARALLNDIGEKVTKFEAQKPQNDSSELVSLMKDVRAALRDENHGAPVGDTNTNSLKIPFTFGQTASEKRRLDPSTRYSDKANQKTANGLHRTGGH